MVRLGFLLLRLEELAARCGLLGLPGGSGRAGLGRDQRLAGARERVPRLAHGALVLGREAAGLDELGLQTGELGERGSLGARRGRERLLPLCEARGETVRAQAREAPLLAREDVRLLLPARGARGLALERGARAVDLGHDVREAQQVPARLLELDLGLALADLVLRDAGRLLDEAAPVLRLRRENEVDLLLLDDRVGPHAEAGAEQDLLHVLQA